MNFDNIVYMCLRERRRLFSLSIPFYKPMEQLQFGCDIILNPYKVGGFYAFAIAIVKHGGLEWGSQTKPYDQNCGFQFEYETHP